MPAGEMPAARKSFHHSLDGRFRREWDIEFGHAVVARDDEFEDVWLLFGWVVGVGSAHRFVLSLVASRASGDARSWALFASEARTWAV